MAPNEWRQGVRNLVRTFCIEEDLRPPCHCLMSFNRHFNFYQSAASSLAARASADIAPVRLSITSPFLKIRKLGIDMML